MNPDEIAPAAHGNAPAAHGNAPAADDSAPVADAGAARNTVLQLVSQLATLGFSAALTLYLVRGLGAHAYGLYTLAAGVAGLLLFPAGLGLPLAVGRFLADHRTSAHQLREILRMGLRVQVLATVIVGGGLFATSGLIAGAYGKPDLAWPLRWCAVALIGQALFGLLTSAGASIRRASLSLWMTLAESASETSASITLVAVGAGAAGAALGKAIGYTVAVAAGMYLTLRLLGRPRSRTDQPRLVSLRSLLRFAGAMFVVDVAWAAIAQIDIILIGALLTSAAVGSFGAVMRVLVVLQYLGLAVSSGVGPRMSLRGNDPDVAAFETGMRYLTIVQGVVLAPMIVWAQPIVHLLLGPGYHGAAAIMRVLTPYYFIAAPASLVTLSVTYLGEARRRVPVMLATLVLGVAATYVLINAQGVIGAGVADNIIEVVYLGAHLWICSTLIDVDLRRFAWCVVRTVIAAAAMALVLLAFGTHRLTPVDWLAGGTAAVIVYAAVLLVTRELTAAELRAAGSHLRAAIRPR